MAHAKISASKVERVMLCPGSLALESNIPDGPSSVIAARGTAIHAIAESYLKGIDIDNSQYEEEMIKIAQTYVEYIDSYGCEPYVEADFTDELSHFHKDLGGTADCVMVKGDTLIVVDLKTGRIPVSAKNNKQLKMYALGALMKFGDQNIKTVEMAIFQPNMAVSNASCSVEEILEFKAELIEAAINANDPFAPLNPGAKQCKYCKAKGVCPALKAKANELAANEFDVVDKSDNEILELADLLGDWAEKVKSLAKTKLQEGGFIDGWQLKPGRKMVKFANQIGTEAYLAGNHLAFTVKSPAQLKKLGIELPEDHLVESLSEPSLVRIEKDL